MKTQKFITIIVLLTVINAVLFVSAYNKQQNNKDYTLEFKAGVIYLTNTYNGKTYVIEVPQKRQTDVKKDFGYALQLAIELDNN